MFLNAPPGCWSATFDRLCENVVYCLCSLVLWPWSMQVGLVYLLFFFFTIHLLPSFSVVQELWCVCSSTKPDKVMTEPCIDWYLRSIVFLLILCSYGSIPKWNPDNIRTMTEKPSKEETSLTFNDVTCSHRLLLNYYYHFCYTERFSSQRAFVVASSVQLKYNNSCKNHNKVWREEDKIQKEQLAWAILEQGNKMETITNLQCVIKPQPMKSRLHSFIINNTTELLLPLDGSQQLWIAVAGIINICFCCSPLYPVHLVKNSRCKGFQMVLQMLLCFFF